MASALVDLSTDELAAQLQICRAELERQGQEMAKMSTETAVAVAKVKAHAVIAEQRAQSAEEKLADALRELEELKEWKESEELKEKEIKEAAAANARRPSKSSSGGNGSVPMDPWSSGGSDPWAGKKLGTPAAIHEPDGEPAVQERERAEEEAKDILKEEAGAAICKERKDGAEEEEQKVGEKEKADEKEAVKREQDEEEKEEEEESSSNSQGSNGNHVKQAVGGVTVSAWGNWNPDAVVPEDHDEAIASKWAQEEEKAEEKKRKKEARKAFGKERKAQATKDAQDTKEALLAANARIAELEAGIYARDEELNKLSKIIEASSSTTAIVAAKAEEFKRAAAERAAQQDASIRGLQQEAAASQEKVRRLETQLQKAQRAAQASVPPTPSASVPTTHSTALIDALELGRVGSGGVVGGLVADVLKDIELGEKPVVTITDLGLGDVAVLQPADRCLKILAALMTVRADARFLVFGAWALCHVMYVLYLIYAHLI